MTELKICRVCLNSNVKGYSFDLNNLRENYEEVTGVKLRPEDGFPCWACYECATLLHKFHKFKEKCYHGQKVLERLQAMVPISYKSVKHINRIEEHLHSKISLVVAHNHTKTFKFKHKDGTQKERQQSKPVTEEDNNHDSDSMKQEDVQVEDILNKEEIVYEKLKVDDIQIKTEPVLEQTFEDLSMDADNVSVGDNASSDDENIFLNIVKKAVNGENQLVFLTGFKNEPVKTKSSKAKPRKFMKMKKEYLNMDYWKKYRLTEEQATIEFKRKEHSDKYVKANYKCHNCFKGFSKLEMLMRHVKMQHNESWPAKCRFCNMRFKRKCDLTKHMVQHYTVYHCLRCDMRFYLETSAIFHEDYHKGVIRKCKHCGEEFKHCSTYYTHVRMAHRSGHICSLCGVSLVSEAGLAQHLRIKHFDREDTEGSSETTETKIYCEKCDVKFISQSAYDRHLSQSDMHTDATADVEVKRRNYKGRGENISDGRKTPKKAKKPTTCIHCGKLFSTQSACMKHHLAEHPRKTFFSADQRHICEVCGASLAAVSIASHMNRHTRENVYSCDICGMQFISKSSHHRHQVTHTGERPYPCSLCDKRFTQKNSMLLHYRTFHLKQPYPKRNRKRKTDEVPIMDSFRERDESDTLQANRWRET